MKKPKVLLHKSALEQIFDEISRQTEFEEYCRQNHPDGTDPALLRPKVYRRISAIAAAALGRERHVVS